MRASLQDAREAFWTGEETDLATAQRAFAVQLNSDGSPKKYGRRGDPNNVMPGLSFFHFTGDEDGEDIKLEFKRRYAELEMLLTDAEKDDVVNEAHIIFESMGAIVKELDFLCRGTHDLAVKAATPPSSGGVKQTIVRLLQPLGPEFGALASMKSAPSSSRKGAAWSMSVLCAIVAVGGAALLWRSIHGNLAMLGFTSLDTTQC